MERPNNLTGNEVSRTLELMGLNRIYEAGPHVIYADQRSGKRLVCFEAEWDMLSEHIERNLELNGYDVQEFWACYERLFETD